MPRKRQKPLGPAPLASFDRGLSSEGNSFEEDLSTLGQSDQQAAKKAGRIGVLCQTSIMEENAAVVKTRSIACQTDRSALRDGVKGPSKQRKSSQSQTSFDQEPVTEAHQAAAVHFRPAPAPSRSEKLYEKQDSLQPDVEADLRAPSPTRPSTLDLTRKQKSKSPTSFNKVQKMESITTKSAAAPAPPEKGERKRSLLGKKASVVSATSGVSEKSESKSRSSSFRSPFNKKRDDTGSASSRSVSPMLQIRQRIASLSPRRKKKNIAKTKLEALLNRTEIVAMDLGTDELDAETRGAGGGGSSNVNNLNVDANRINRDRPGSMNRAATPSQSLSPKPSRTKKDSHAFSKLQALIDRTRMVHIGDHANHEHALTTHADVHHPGDRRRSKSTPPEPDNLHTAHRLSLGEVWHHHHGHAHGHRDSHSNISNKSPSNPPSPFEVTKKFSIQEDKESPSDKESDTEIKEYSPSHHHHLQPEDTTDIQQATHSEQKQGTLSPLAEIEEEKKEALLTVDEHEEEASSTGDLLDKIRKEKVQEEQLLLRKKVQEEREKRQTFRTAPVERPRSQTREIAVVDLHAYVAEAEKQPVSSPTQRIKLNLHLNQDHSLDEDASSKPVKDRQADPENWRNFCEQGLLTKRRSRLERSRGSEALDETASSWADFELEDHARRSNQLPIPVIIETAWTPQEHRVITVVTPSPSICWDSQDGTAHPASESDQSRSPSFDDFSGNAFTQTANSSSTNSFTEPTPSTTPHQGDTSAVHFAEPAADTVSQPNAVTITVESAAQNMDSANSSIASPAASENVVQPASSALPSQTVPVRKAPPAPSRKAPAPPPPKSTSQIPESSKIPETVTTVETTVSREHQEASSGDVANVPNVDPTATWSEHGTDYYAADGNYNYDPSAYYYAEGYTDDNGYNYAQGYYESWQPTAAESAVDNITAYHTDTSYYGNNTGTSYQAQVVLDNTGEESAINDYIVNSGADGVTAVLGSQADPTGHDVVMSDPSAIDIAVNNRVDDSIPEEHSAQASLESALLVTRIQEPSQLYEQIVPSPANINMDIQDQLGQEQSPLLEADDAEGEEDMATTLLNSDAAHPTAVSSAPADTERDPSFQPLVEDTTIDQTDIDYTMQTKHRRLSKVPYTSLDVEENPEDEGSESTQNVPEEETVEPLLQGAADVAETEEDVRDERAGSSLAEHAVMPLQSTDLPEATHYPAVEAHEQPAYDPAIYDPAGTGYDINSQEYYDYYYGAQYGTGYSDEQTTHQSTDQTYPTQPAEYYQSQNNYDAVPASETSSYYHDQSAGYNYDQSYAYGSEYNAATESQPTTTEYYDQSWGAAQTTEPEWPTFNAYVQPEAAAHTEQYADTSDEEEIAPATSAQSQLESTLPKERLFDDTGDILPYGNLRPEPKKKDTTVPGYKKVAKGLKPSKKKIVNLITKGKYSSGKKKDLFDEMEADYMGGHVPQAPGRPGQAPPSPQSHSKEWQEYQKLTARVQGAVEQAKQKITPVQTPTSPPHGGPKARKTAGPDISVQSNANDLLGLYDTDVVEAAPTPETGKKGPPSRPPPPSKGKGAPGRPPPPSKKAESVPEMPATQADKPLAQANIPPSASSVSDELADFFGAPVPSPPVRTATVVQSKAEPAKARPVPVTPKVVATDIKPIARPKAGSVKQKTAPVTELRTVPVPAVPQPAAVTKASPVAKMSNIDDLLGLFDAPVTETTATGNVSAAEMTVDPFSTAFDTGFVGPTSVSAAPEAPEPDVFGDSGYITQPSLVSESPGPLDDPFGSDAANMKPSAIPTERQTNPWEEETAPDSTKLNSAAWEPWDTPAGPIPPPPSPRPGERRLPPVPPRPVVPPRPSPVPSPAPTPAMSRKEMFLNSTSQDSDATFAAAFGHTQDEDPEEEISAPFGRLQTETKIISQVESMVGQSETSPLPTRKQAQAIPVKSENAWGEGTGEQTATFVTDFDNDPFSSGQTNMKPSSGTDESNVFELIAKYKSNAPENINLDVNNLDNSFFDPFATIVPEESPLPVQTANAITTEDDKFDIWESPQRPEGLPVRKQSVNRRSSVQSNASRRTSGSAQTPLFDEDDTQPLAEFTWDVPQTSWDLLLRWPPKKTLTGNRFWKPIHVKLTDTVLQLCNKPDDQKPFHEVPLSGQYMITEISIQPLDVFTKIHTTKLEYVFYKERVGIRPGQIPKITKGQITKLGLPLEHASQTTELLKFGCISLRTLKNFIHAIEDALFRMPMVRERPMSYKQEEVQAHVIDEFTARVDKSGIISDRKGRVRVFCLCFVSGMPTVEFGLNDIVRRGKEVVGRHDILPIYTEEWIRMENVDLHHCISKEEYNRSKMIKLIPPDATFFELARFRVRPPKNRELPLAVKAIITIEGYKVLIRVETMTTSYYTRKRAQPCDDIQIRVPIPERWVYLFRTETLFGYGAKHATKKTTGILKGMSEKLRSAGTDSQAVQHSMIEVSTGSARYEHVFRSLVWRISRLPKEGQGAYANHLLCCRLSLNAYDAMPERFEQNAEVEFTMPAATASHTTLRSISATTEEPPEKFVKYLAKYDYTVEIDYKIDRGDVQMYGADSQDL